MTFPIRRASSGLILGGLVLGGAGVAIYNFLNNKRSDTTLTRTGFTPVTLGSKQQLTHDASKFRFTLDPAKSLGSYTSSAVLFRVTMPDGKTQVRPYTPVSLEDQKGFCEFVIKRYDNDGAVSKVIHSLNEGDTVEMWGPVPNFTYVPGRYSDIGLIAGGSGITPMFQLINRIISDPKDKTKVTLLFANKTENDIILRDRLDQLAKENPEKLDVHYVVGEGERWTGETGRVDTEKIKKYMPGPADSTFIGVCGPDPMLESVCGKKPTPFSQGKIGGILAELGYSNVFKY